VAVPALVGLDRRLAVDHRGDDLAVLRGGLLTHDHPVTVADRGFDHRVADDLQHEQRALADQLAGEGEHVLHRLLGEHRTTGGDAADQWHVGRGRERLVRAGRLLREGRGRAGGVAREPDVERARAVRVAPQPPLLLQHGELVGHRRGGGEADGLSDLAHRRRVAPPVDGVADDLQDPALALGQPVAVGAAVGEGAHGGRAALRLRLRRRAARPPAARCPAGLRHVSSSRAAGAAVLVAFPEP